MNYKVTKLDRRHTGHEIFKYYIMPVTDVWGHVAQYGKASREHMILHEWRVWLWETYGPGIERDLAGKDDQIRWAWDTEHGNKRIYLKSDAEMTLFKLKYGG